MGAGFSGDNRLGYTESDVFSYWNWAKAKKEYHVFLRNYPYSSPGDDMLQYQGCVSFNNDGYFNMPPCYTLEFQARDSDLRGAVVGQLQALKARLGFLEGPATVMVYRDYNSLGHGKDWFNRNDRNYNWFKRMFRGLPLSVRIFLPSITPEGLKAPNYAFMGKTHRWVTDFVFLPHSSVYNDWMMQCYTYCLDERGRFFPCGCSWEGECEAKVAGVEGVLDNTAKRKIFYGAYSLDLHHPSVSRLFAEAEYRNYHYNILPMKVDMYANCRHGLQSLNGAYAFNLERGGGIVLRKGAPGTKRVCERRGWWIFARTVCWDERYPGWDFRTACRFIEIKKFSFRDCNDSNGMCQGKSNAENGALYGEQLPKNGWHEYYRLRYKKAMSGLGMMLLEPDKVIVYSEDRSDVYVWSIKHIPEDIRVPPLALVLTDKGELVIYNGRNQRVASWSKDGMDFDVRKDDENYTGEDEDEDGYRRLMQALNFDRWRTQQRDMGDATLDNLNKITPKQRADGVCPAPPFQFI